MEKGINVLLNATKLTAEEEAQYKEVADHLIEGVASQLKTKLNISDELAQIWGDEIINAAYDVVCDVVKEFTLNVHRDVWSSEQ